jgi:hypothetical protein
LKLDFTPEFFLSLSPLTRDYDIYEVTKREISKKLTPLPLFTFFFSSPELTDIFKDAVLF